MTQYVEAALGIYYTNELGYNLLLGAAVIGIAYLLSREKHEWWNLIPRRRGKAMRRARRDWVRRDAIDAFVNHVEERVYNKEYSRKEATELYRDARKYWPVRELFPSPERLKEDIKRRLAAHINEEVSLPDKKEKAQPKHMFEKLAKA